MNETDFDIKIESDNSISIATCNFQDIIRYNNKNRLNFLQDIIGDVNNNADVILLPAGFFSYKRLSLGKIKKVTRKISELVNNSITTSNVCFGIDCDYGQDQLAVSVDKSGICGMARKFFPTADEKGYIFQAESHLDKEFGFPRIIQIKDKKVYLAVCYDSFGIKKQDHKNPGVDYIFNLVHRFDAFGNGNSGDVLFARHGLAGASKQWDCPVFAAVCFNDRDISVSWPTGVMWNLGNSSTRAWKYADNTLHYKSEKIIKHGSAIANIRVY